MADKVVIYGGRGFLKHVLELRPNLKVMPEADNAATLEKIETELHPRVVAFDAQDFKDDVIALARKNGSEIYVDRLGEADNQASWKDALDRGANGIQTDHPAELVAFLRSLGLHH